jgi:hypothetical protein
VDELTVTLKAREFIGKMGPLALPVSIDAYAAAAGATVKVDDLEPGEAGWSFQKPNGDWCICVNRQDRPERQRFTVCHEVAHIALGLPHEHGYGPAWSYAKRPATEVWCDVFASELLLPHKLFKPQVDAAELGLAAIDELSGVFEASTMATGSRFAAFSSCLCAFVLSEQGRVRYCSRSPTMRDAKAWISAGSALPDASLSKRLRAGDVGAGPQEIEADVWFSDWDREGALYEDARHLAQWDQTIALLWFDDNDLPSPREGRGKWEEQTYGLRELDGELPWPGRRKRR